MKHLLELRNLIIIKFCDKLHLYMILKYLLLYGVFMLQKKETNMYYIIKYRDEKITIKYSLQTRETLLQH